MLDFSDAPYRFFEPKPNGLVIGMSRWVNRRIALPGPNHLIEELEIEGGERLRALAESGARIMLAPNHPTHSDPQVMSETDRRLGVRNHFMAAYDVFLRSRMQGWILQHNGAFSVDREGSDSRSLKTALKLLQESPMGLTIFPEGNVYLCNDRVTPFLEGAFFIALKAHRSLAPDRGVHVVPVSLKYSYIEDVRPQVNSALKALEADVVIEEAPEEDPIKQLTRLGRYLLAEHLERRGMFREMAMVREEDLWQGLSAAAERVLHGLEGDLELTSTPELSPMERVRRARARIHQIRIDENSKVLPGETQRWADRAMFAFRVLSYGTPYAGEHPSLDRYAETVERLMEDHYARIHPPFGRRKACVQIGEAIDLAEFLDSFEGKPREAVGALARKVETAVQDGIDQANTRLDTPGSALFST